MLEVLADLELETPMKKYGRVLQLLAEVGAVLKRDKKHRVYALPNGRNFVVANTPSDSRGELNSLSDLRKALDLPRETKPASPPKPKARKPGREEPLWQGLPAPASPLASALRESGLVEQQLRAKIDQLERELVLSADRIRMLQQQIESLRIGIRARDRRLAELHRWWVVRVWRWVRR